MIRGFLLLLLSLPAALSASPQWINPSWQPSHLEKLNQGEVVLFQPHRRPNSGAMLAGAVFINAPREKVRAVITDPERSKEYLSNLKEVRLLHSTSTSQTVAHTVRSGILPFNVSYRYRAEKMNEGQIHFRMIDGDLRHFEGGWRLHEAKDFGYQQGTIVFYQLYVDPGALIPKVMVGKNLKRDLPSMLVSLRQRVYHLAQG
ncbi:MAG: SRPBCC family protein [Verrucomicrobiota bacterium]